MPQRYWRLVGAAVERLEVRAVGGAGAVEEGDVRILLGELLERVGIAEGRADDDVVALADEELGRRRDGGGVLRHVLDDRGSVTPIDFSMRWRASSKACDQPPSFFCAKMIMATLGSPSSLNSAECRRDGQSGEQAPGNQRLQAVACHVHSPFLVLTSLLPLLLDYGSDGSL